MFKDLVQFIERQVGILMDPLFGDIRDLPTSMRPVNRPKLKEASLPLPLHQWNLGKLLRI